MLKHLDIIKKSILFNGLSEAEVVELIEKLEMHLRHLDKDEYWACEGSKVKEIGIILEGSLSVYKTASDGRENLLQKIGRRSVTGIEFVSTRSGISPYDIKAAEETKLCQFNWSYIENSGVISEKIRLRILRNMLMLVSHENIRKTNKIDILMQKGIRNKVMAYLSIQKSKHGKDTFFIPFSREELAAYLCVNRSALSHELTKMEEEGLIIFKLNQFTVLY